VAALDPVIVVAVIASVPPTIAALAALRRSSQNATALKEVHVLVNSNLTQVKADLESALQELRTLKREQKDP